ncbi:MAG: hypothetical protein E6F98_05365 [Actinobacteria bacterium]|nr:MAG: hypothetical protein E6F98_05365 [Actinomycetota bacterium]
MRLPPQTEELLDRSHEVVFSFAGKPVRAYAGDTIGSALFASGRRVFSRSFKYHRPRGLYCCSGGCPNCMLTVDGTPNVRACVEPVREGAVVEPQNVLGSLDRDLLSIVDKVGRPFTPVGFYYRTMIRPRRLWPLYEKFLRNVAGLGRIDKHRGRTTRYDVEHRRVEVLVIGGGRSGLQAARAAAANGERVLLVDENARRYGNEPFEIVAPGRALGIYEGGLVPVDAGRLLLRVRAVRIVVATGALEQPLVFPGNDLVGVMLPDGARRLIRDFALKPGSRAVVLAADDRALAVIDDLERVGVAVVARVDLREHDPVEISAEGRSGRLRAVSIDGVRHQCDLLLAAGAPQPAYSLLAQAGARVSYDAARGVFVATALPPGVEAVGRVAGDLGRLHPARACHGKDGFVCICEDVAVKDMKRALAEGFDSIEPPLPAARGPAARARDRDRRSGRRDDHGAAAVAAGVTRAARRPRPRAGDADVDPSSRGARRDDDVDGQVAQAALLRRSRRGGGSRPPLGRRDRRLHARQAARGGAGRRGVPRTPLSESLWRPEARACPLRRALDRRRPDHG